MLLRLCQLLCVVAALGFEDRDGDFCLPLWTDLFGSETAFAFYLQQGVTPLCYTYPAPAGKAYEVVPQIGVLWNNEKEHADLVIYKMTHEALQRAANRELKSGSMRASMNWWAPEADGMKVAGRYNSFVSGYKYIPIDGECVGFDRGHLAPFHDFAFYTSNRPKMPGSLAKCKALAEKWEAIVLNNGVVKLTKESIKMFEPGELDLLHQFLPAFNSFVMSNQVPQENVDNSGYWKASAENALRNKLLNLKKTSYILTGPLWDYDTKRPPIETKVATKDGDFKTVQVPRNLFKVAFVKPTGASVATPYMALDILLGQPCYDAGSTAATNSDIASRVGGQLKPLGGLLTSKPVQSLVELQRSTVATGPGDDDLKDVHCKTGLRRALIFLFRLYTDAAAHQPALVSLSTMPALRMALSETFVEIMKEPGLDLLDSSVLEKSKEKLQDAVQKAMASLTKKGRGKRERVSEVGMRGRQKEFHSACAFSHEVNNAYKRFVQEHQSKLRKLIVEGVDLRPSFEAVVRDSLQTFGKPEYIVRLVVRHEFSKLRITFANDRRDTQPHIESRYRNTVKQPESVQDLRKHRKSRYRNTVKQPESVRDSASQKSVGAAFSKSVHQGKSKNPSLPNTVVPPLLLGTVPVPPTPGLAVDLPTSAVQPDLTSESNPIPSGPDSEVGSGNGIGCADDTEFDQAISTVCPFTAEVGDDQSQSQMLDVARHHVSCNSDLLLNKLERLGLLQKSEVALNRRVCDGFEEMVQQEFDQIRARIADIYDQ